MAVKRSVLEVDVDDRKFKQYVESYKKYSDSVNKLPVAWGKVTKENKATVDAIRMMTASMMANMDVMRKVGDHAKAVNDNARKTALSWKSITDSTKTAGSHLKSFYTSFMRWTGIGTFVGGAAGVGGLFGFERLAQSAALGRRSSTGLGVTYGQQAAFGLAYNRLLDASAFMGAVSTGRGMAGSGQAAALYSLGVMGKGGTAETSAAAIRRIHELSQGKSDTDLGFLLQGRQLGELGVGLEDLRRFRGMNKSQLEEYISQQKLDEKGLNVDDARLKKMQDFDNALERAGLRIKSALIDGLSDLAGPLKTLTDNLTEAASELIKSDGFKWVISKISDGLKWFAEYVGKPDFKQDIHDLGEGIKKLAQSVIDGLKWLGLIPGSAKPAGVGGNNTGPTFEEFKASQEEQMKNEPDSMKERRRGRMRMLYDDYLQRNGLTEPSGGYNPMKGPAFGNIGGVSGPGGYGGPGDYEKDISAFMKMGWTRAQATGIVANIEAESGGRMGAVGDGGSALGLAQWHPDRQAMFKKVFGHDIKDSLRDEQLKFIDWELRNSEAAAGMRLRAAGSAGEAGGIVSRYYERPGLTESAKSEAERNRAAAANRIAGLPKGMPAIEINIFNNSGSNVGVSAGTMGVSGAGLGVAKR